MASVTHVKSFRELSAAMKRDMRKVERRLDRARERAAEKVAAHVRRNVPVAFSELRDSVHTIGTRVVADAPHAFWVEIGSRPHWPPLEPLIAWVKLRGFQGLASPSAQRRMPGTTTASHASSVAGQIRAAESGGSVGMDAPERIARAIAHHISVHGTKAHFFMREAVPVAKGFLGVEVARALKGAA